MERTKRVFTEQVSINYTHQGSLNDRMSGFGRQEAARAYREAIASTAKKNLTLAYKASSTGSGAVLYATGVTANGVLKTALYGPAIVIAVPTYAIGRYTAASVRNAMNYMTNKEVDSKDLIELNHESGFKTALGFSIVPLDLLLG